MPFTQKQIDEAFDTVCRYHGVDPVEWRKRVGGPPLLGSDIQPQPRRAHEISAIEAVVILYALLSYAAEHVVRLAALMLSS